MELLSNSFENGKSIPDRFTVDGENISPPLEIEGVSDNAETLALIMDDPDAPGSTFVHWIIWNIPADVNEIPAGVSPGPSVENLSGARQGKNDFGELGYGGPAPPSGRHHYRFKLYSLADAVELPAGATKSDLLDKIKDPVIEKVELVGIYSRT